MKILSLICKLIFLNIYFTALDEQQILQRIDSLLWKVIYFRQKNQPNQW